MEHTYPFAAIVGQEQMKQALLLNLLDPALGGVLIRGEKGMAKSTAVRGLTDLLDEIQVSEGGPFHCRPGYGQLCPSCLAKAEIHIGNMVNLYPYCASVISQALIAKRRGYAATIGYLPAPGKGLTPEQRRLAEHIRRYFEAQEQESGQAGELAREIRGAALQSPALQAILDWEPDFDAALREIRAMLSQTEAARLGGGKRALGSAPDGQRVRDYIAGVWLSDGDADARWPQDPLERAAAIDAAIEAALAGGDTSPTAEDARTIAAGLGRAGEEMDAQLHALAGGYLPAEAGGNAACGGRELLPTGRNLCGMEQGKAPTPAAYRRGQQAAADLLTLYRAETGRLPGKAAVNMTSLDIVRTGGEQLGQFLALLGVKPIWSLDGRVDGLVCVPLDELGRPRIDVTAHISCHACKYLLITIGAAYPRGPGFRDFSPHTKTPPIVPLGGVLCNVKLTKFFQKVQKLSGNSCFTVCFCFL